MENIKNKPSKKPASEKILNVAEKLFYKEGIQAVGIDKIIKESKVAMNTLYKHFPSKDILVESYLKERDIKWRSWLNSYIDKDRSPMANILSIFDALHEWFNSDNYRGCAFINASGEVGGIKSFVHEISKFHKESIYNDILLLLSNSHIKNKEKLVNQIMILIEGAIVRAYISEDKKSAIYAKEVAEIILEYNF